METAGPRPRSAPGRVAAGTVAALAVFLAVQSGLSWLRSSGIVGLRAGRALGGGPTGVPAGAADPDASETTWCAYAWPSAFDKSGLETFCITADGTMWKSEDARYDGPGAGPPAGAAFPSGGLDAIGGPAAETDRTRSEHVGQDGNVWRRAN